MSPDHFMTSATSSSSGAICHLRALYASFWMHQQTRVPTLQRGLSSPNDVTLPASVIERDTNPAPLQSLAVGWGRTEREGY